MKVFDVVLADDHKLFVEGMKAILEGLNGQYRFNLVGIAHDGSSLQELLKTVSCQIVLLDLNLPDINGIELIPVIKDNYPKTLIIVISGYGEPKLVRKAFKNGIDGYLLKNSSLKELQKGFVEVISGRPYWGEGLRLSPIKTNGSRDKNRNKSRGLFEDKFTIKQQLTRRESEILSLISQAQSNKDIASELFISPETVSVHRKNIMRKLGVNSTASLIKFALDHNLI
ncbi:MAG: response regulator transcription factor [Saprospiraceae bacterium]|nr:response regulator transcription factor [Saprospiraceae bacterium]